MKARKRGRPEQGTGISEDAILDSALTLLSGEGVKFSMRSLARQLNVDVMALYHYFPTKNALLDAALLVAFAPLNDSRLAFDREGDVIMRLEVLAAQYLEIVRQYPGLTVDIITGRVAAPQVVTRFAELFSASLQPLELRDDDIKHATHVLVDYLHGFMLSGHSGEEWRFGVRLLAAGLQHLSLE